VGHALRRDGLAQIQPPRRESDHGAQRRRQVLERRDARALAGRNARGDQHERNVDDLAMVRMTVLEAAVLPELLAMVRRQHDHPVVEVSATVKSPDQPH
jgi:hypothetical protein